LAGAFPDRPAECVCANPSRSRSRISAPMAAAFRSAFGLSVAARRPAPSIAPARQSKMSSRGNLAGQSGTGDGLCLPEGVDDGRSGNAQEVAPGKPSATCAAALTFGRPGKQKVKQVRMRDFFSRVLSALTQIVKYFTGATRQPDRIMIPSAESLLPRSPLGQYDLLLQKIRKSDPLGLERLRIKRSLGQSRQGVGFEIDDAVLGDDEVGARITSARQRAMRPDRVLLEGGGDLRREAARADLL